MKRKILIIGCLLCATALTLIFHYTQISAPLDRPPILEIRCDGQSKTSGFWHAGWDSPTAEFVADGYPPYSSEGRDKFPLFQAAPGETVFLSFSVVPQEVKVSMNYDVPMEEMVIDLYDGPGDQVSITLPENCGGAYTVSANWYYGSASYGFIIEDTETAPHEVVEDVPILSLSWNGENFPSWQGSWTWRVPNGSGSFTETSVAAQAPLIAKEVLPVISATPGEEIRLEFSKQPYEVEVWAVPGKYVADPENASSEQVLLVDNSVLIIPSNGTDVVYEVFSNWDFSLLNGGQSFYGFYVP